MIDRSSLHETPMGGTELILNCLLLGNNEFYSPFWLAFSVAFITFRGLVVRASLNSDCKVLAAAEVCSGVLERPLLI